MFCRHVSVHEKIDILNERLEAAGGDKIDDGPQGSKASVSIKKCEYLLPVCVRVCVCVCVCACACVCVCGTTGIEGFRLHQKV